MINWDLLSPRNLFVVALLSLLAVAIYKHFAGPSDTNVTTPPGTPSAAAQ